VHDQTERLRTWIDNLKPSAPTLDRMIFGGDYPDRMKENTSWTIAQQCVAIVQAAFDPNTPCVLVRGNHDKQDGNYAQGLVYNGDDYAVYAMDVDSSAFTSWSFFNPISMSWPLNWIVLTPLNRCSWRLTFRSIIILVGQSVMRMPF